MLSTPLLVRKQRFGSRRWTWFCRRCMAHDFQSSWDRAMQEAEAHWDSHRAQKTSLL
jgi:hypothetical protein